MRAVRPAWLALLAGPLSFGITGPALVLPEVAHDLGVSRVSATALVTAFGWGIAVGTPVAGVLQTRRGVRAALRTHVLLVVAGALLVLGIPRLPVLVAGMALMALGAAGMTVAALSLTRSARAMGLVTASLAVFGAAAPLVGTAVTAALSWQAALVMPLLSLPAVPAVLRSTAAVSWPPDAQRFDSRGAFLFVAALTALVLVPRFPLWAGGAAAVLAVVLSRHVRRLPGGFVPAAVLGSRRFSAAAGLAFALAVVNFGIVYAAPDLLATQTGWSPAELGVALLIPYVTGGAVSAALVAASVRLRWPLLTGSLAAGAAAALLSITCGGSATPLLFAGMLLGSLAASTGQGALGHRAAAAVPLSARATALGLFSVCFLLGAAFGPAIATTTTS
ncbi:MFS transporter [Streptomyces sp. WMMC500]|uniref:MFS transporter n=1 Tax=Streptomyces sp. WMMC500 TaxID=3015154 RepID=UPI00248D2D41|nr:MFS transporter [Streptomyces sp. WMMC500]WBB59659.1 MFS transporter [Streptomyces sp. WMMC500]